MGAGVEAVTAEIEGEFHPSDIHGHYDVDSMSTVLGFTSEGRRFSVRVSQEFDQDYEHGHLNVDLSKLGPVLRSSKDGKATVKTSGISAT